MNLKKIVDSTLIDGHFVLNNDNDRVNFINRVCPNISEEEQEDLFDALREVASKDDSKFYFVLSDEPLRDSVLEWPVENMTISFKEVL